VDRITTQLEITIRVVELSKTSQLEYGFDFFLDRSPASQSALRSINATYNNRSFLDSLLTSSPFQGTTLEFASVGSVVTDIGDLSVVLRALEEKGVANIISEPSIKIHSGETAEINSLRKEPIPQLEQINPTTTRITTRYEDVGVKLKVTVKNIGREAALLEVNPEVSTVQSFTDPQTFGGLTVPKIATRSAKTVLDVKDGDVFTIGGLKDNRILVEHRQVPILGSIPLIGILFKSRREREEKIELLFILEIHILGEEKKTTLYDPGQ
jgi:pilus assembly protein CpaC